MHFYRCSYSSIDIHWYLCIFIASVWFSYILIEFHSCSCISCIVVFVCIDVYWCSCADIIIIMYVIRYCFMLCYRPRVCLLLAFICLYLCLILLILISCRSFISFSFLFILLNLFALLPSVVHCVFVENHKVHNK